MLCFNRTQSIIDVSIGNGLRLIPSPFIVVSTICMVNLAVANVVKIDVGSDPNNRKLIVIRAWSVYISLESMFHFIYRITGYLANPVVLWQIKYINVISVSNSPYQRSRLYCRKVRVYHGCCMFPVKVASVVDMMKLSIFFKINIKEVGRSFECTKTVSSSSSNNIWLSVFPVGLYWYMSVNEFSWLFPVVNIDVVTKPSAGGFLFSDIGVKRFPVIFPLAPFADTVMNQLMLVANVVNIDGFSLPDHCRSWNYIIANLLFLISPLGAGITKIMRKFFVSFSNIDINIFMTANDLTTTFLIDFRLRNNCVFHIFWKTILSLFFLPINFHLLYFGHFFSFYVL